jgi:predicted nucleotidyltransferase
VSPEPTGELLALVVRALHDHGVDDLAFTGGVAVGVWAEARQTRDVDVCGTLPPAEVNRLLAQRDGMRTGPGEIPDAVRFRVGDWDIDLFLCKDEYDRTCLGRAVPAEIDGVSVRVVTAEDLLIHKLIKLRTDRRRLLQDVADMRAVITEQGDRLDWDYLRRWLPAVEADLLTTVASSTDDELLRRVLGQA